MSEPGTRPGGLTALAVINFVFGAFGILGGIGTLVTPLWVGKEVEYAEAAESRSAEAKGALPESTPAVEGSERKRAHQDDMRELARKLKDIPYYLFVVAAAVEVVLAIMLIVAGIGYLKLRRFMGRTLGTVYAVAAILWAFAQLLYMDKVMEENFGLLNMLGFLYPAVTLFLLRLTFKDDFVNP